MDEKKRLFGILEEGDLMISLKGDMMYKVGKDPSQNSVSKGSVIKKIENKWVRCPEENSKNLKGTPCCWANDIECKIYEIVINKSKTDFIYCNNTKCHLQNTCKRYLPLQPNLFLYYTTWEPIDNDCLGFVGYEMGIEKSESD